MASGTPSPAEFGAFSRCDGFTLGSSTAAAIESSAASSLEGGDATFGGAFLFNNEVATVCFEADAVRGILPEGLRALLETHPCGSGCTTGCLFAMCKVSPEKAGALYTEGAALKLRRTDVKAIGVHITAAKLRPRGVQM